MKILRLKNLLPHSIKLCQGGVNDDKGNMFDSSVTVIDPLTLESGVSCMY